MQTVSVMVWKYENRISHSARTLKSYGSGHYLTKSKNRCGQN